jgi:hypothetical protein
MKAKIESLCKSGFTQKRVAAELHLEVYQLHPIVREYWPETGGRWTDLRKLFGLDPWGTINLCPHCGKSRVLKSDENPPLQQEQP